MPRYTSGSAFAEFQEGEKGTIARGKLAISRS
jgi:predicted amidohydrolase YtcJ